MTREMLRALPWPAILIGVVIVAAGLLAPWIAPYDPFTPSPVDRLQPPSFEHLLGTDTLGRDVLSRVIFGARTTLVIVAFALTLGSLFGLVIGLFAGYLGGAVDAFVSRLMDALLAFPTIFFALLLAVTIGAGLLSVVLAISLVLWARFARVIRGEALALKEREFVTQARLYSASTPRILFVHLLPNVASAFMVLISINMGNVIIFEAILSFLGAGVPPPNPSWGGMIAEGQNYLTSAWWLALTPGVAILLSVLAFNLVGDWLRDFLDPKQRDFM